MANIGQKDGIFHVRFRSKEYKKSLKTHEDAFDCRVQPLDQGEAADPVLYRSRDDPQRPQQPERVHCHKPLAADDFFPRVDPAWAVLLGRLHRTGPACAAAPDRATADKWLLAALAGRPRPARQFQEEARAVGYCARTLERAKRRVRMDGRAFWQWSEPALPYDAGRRL